MNVTAQSEVGELSQVILKGPRDAYGDQKFASIQWRDLNYTACPDFERAVTEYEAFVNSLGDVAIHWLPQNDATTLDSIYVRDNFASKMLSGTPRSSQNAWPGS